MNKTLINDYRIELFSKINSASCDYFALHYSKKNEIMDYFLYYLLDGYFN
jgi:hypothetical protein